MRPVAFALIGVVLLAAASSPALATCGSPRLFHSESYIYTPGIDPETSPTQTSVTSSFTGSFWGLGFGDPEPSSGIDNGRFEAFANDPGLSQWVNFIPGYPAYVQSTWAASPLIDACIDQATPAGSAPCMAVSFGDQHDGQGYFAILSQSADHLLNFRFTPPDEGPITLAAVPPPSIRETVPIESGAIDIFIDPPELTSGFYLDPVCEQRLPAIAGYRIYGRQLPAGSMPPDDRNIESGWVAMTPIVSLGENTTVRALCEGEMDLFLTLGLAFDSGYETPFLSPNADVVRCRTCPEGSDLDGDGFCAGPEFPPVDCDDTDPSVFPGAIQACDGVNNDCDDPEWPLVPQDEVDGDDDGFPACSEKVVVFTLADCDDADASIGPLAPETCNGIDDDCDGAIDEDAAGQDTDRDGFANACDNCVFHANPGQADADADGVGDACDACLDSDNDGSGSPGHASCPGGAATDCNDLDRYVLPGAPEVYDGRDNDCDGLVDEGLDLDGDGIPNFRDMCPNTPAGFPVTPNGCLAKTRDLTLPSQM